MRIHGVGIPRPASANTAAATATSAASTSDGTRSRSPGIGATLPGKWTSLDVKSEGEGGLGKSGVGASLGRAGLGKARYSLRMPERSRRRPTDVNELAVQVVGEATGEIKP